MTPDQREAICVTQAARLPVNTGRVYIEKAPELWKLHDVCVCPVICQ